MRMPTIIRRRPSRPPDHPTGQYYEIPQLDFRVPRTFSFQGCDLPYFFHGYNCGWPPLRTTERSVELAIADAWLNRLPWQPERLCEVGAVTSYYWPGRVRYVIDPADPHPLVTNSASLFSESFLGRTVLSISTVEHVGTEDYGLSEARDAIDAILKIVSESERCLVSYPVGYNAALDAELQARGKINGAHIAAMVRIGAHTWDECDVPFALQQPYGPEWANALIIIEKGTILTPSLESASCAPAPILRQSLT